MNIWSDFAYAGHGPQIYSEGRAAVLPLLQPTFQMYFYTFPLLLNQFTFVFLEAFVHWYPLLKQQDMLALVLPSQEIEDL